MAIELVYFPPTKPTDIVSNGMTFLHKRAKNFGSADVEQPVKWRHDFVPLKSNVSDIREI
jgi:hypothetical protein